VEGGGNLKLLKQSIKSLEDKKVNTIDFKDYKMNNNLEELKEKIHAVVTKLSKAENAIKLLEEET
jgi:flagellar capping protein FliD